jgi:hypothetical protein
MDDAATFLTNQQCGSARAGFSAHANKAFENHIMHTCLNCAERCGWGVLIKLKAGSPSKLIARIA